jgi:tetratricopeptide (TPR) repeat protein
MARERVGTGDLRRAGEYERAGLQAYNDWDIDRAIQSFRAAVNVAPDEPQYVLYLAQALARSGDFDQALRALAEFIRLEPDSPLTDRFQQLFASGMDDVEQLLTNRMTSSRMSIEEIGAAIQMWLEYRIALGSQVLVVRKPESWAAGLDYTIRKVNLRPVTRREMAKLYGVSETALHERHENLVNALDVMPCDYRYFTGEENPLDKLVEAAELLKQLETRFREG